MSKKQEYAVGTSSELSPTYLEHVRESQHKIKKFFSF